MACVTEKSTSVSQCRSRFRTNRVLSRVFIASAVLRVRLPLGETIKLPQYPGRPLWDKSFDDYFDLQTSFSSVSRFLGYLLNYHSARWMLVVCAVSLVAGKRRTIVSRRFEIVIGG